MVELCFFVWILCVDFLCGMLVVYTLNLGGINSMLVSRLVWCGCHCGAAACGQWRTAARACD